jgi:hypothetical protein
MVRQHLETHEIFRIVATSPCGLSLFVSPIAHADDQTAAESAEASAENPIDPEAVRTLQAS